MVTGPIAGDWQAALRQFADEVRALYGPRLQQVRLYGSRARGDSEPVSDVDVLVVLDEIEDFWAEFHTISPLASRASLAHAVVISALPVSSRELAEGQTGLLANARREGVPVA